MKIYLTLAGILCLNICLAQTKDTLTLKDLEIPNSPGFILLDEAPTSIERPNTVKAFTMGIFNSFSENNGFPKNYAVEATPFWFKKHKKDFNHLSFIGFKSSKNVQSPDKFNFASSIEMVSFSLAYVTKTDTVKNTPINNIAFGARANLFKVYTRKQLIEINRAHLNSVATLQAIEKRLVEKGVTPALNVSNPAEYKRLEIASARELNDSLKAILKKNVYERPILSMDLAAAYNTFFVNNDFSTHQLGRVGVWSTLNFSLDINKKNDEKKDYLNLYVVGRYILDGMKKNEAGDYIQQNFWDFGGKAELEFKKLTFGYEIISRQSKEIHTWRSTGNIKYKLLDNLYLTGAFGKNFGVNKNLVSLFGINWGFTTGNEKVSK